MRLRTAVFRPSVCVRGLQPACAPQRRGAGVCVVSGEGPPTPVPCQRPPAPGRGEGGRATTRAERRVLSPRPASSPRRRVGGGGPGAGGLGGCGGSARPRPMAAAGSAEGARDSVPGDPLTAQGAGKPSLPRPAQPSAGRSLWAGVARAGAGGGGSSGGKRRAAQATLPCPLLPPQSQHPPSL